MASRHTNNVLDSYTSSGVPGNLDKLKDVARKELGETDELKEECLQQLRKLIKDNNVTCITGDDFLLRFLRTRKFDVQRSFEMLRNYAKHRVAINKVLLKLQPQTLKRYINHGIFHILPYRDEEDRLIFFHRTGIWNHSIASDEECFMIMILYANYLAEEMASQTSGVVILHDVKCLPLAHVPFVVRYGSFLMNVFFESLPMMFQMLHFVNESSVLKYVLRLLDPFMPKEIKAKMLFHGQNREDLFQHITPAILPDDLGGSLGTLDNDYMVERICGFLQKMKDEQHHFLQQNT